MNFNFRNDKSVDLRQFSKYANYMLQTGWEILRLKNGTFAYKRSLGLLGSIIKIQRFEWPIDLGEVGELAKKHRAHFVKLEPNIQIVNNESKIKKIFNNYGFKLDTWPLIPPKTRIIDLEKSGGKILEDWSENGRRNLRKAKKEGVRVKIETRKNGFVFYKHWRLVAKKRGLVIPSEKNFQAMAKSFGKDFAIIQCFDKNNVWLGGIVMLVADFLNADNKQPRKLHGLKPRKIAYYYFATANGQGKKLRAPYLATWTAIMEAKKRGCEIFDFEGIADSRFKETNSRAWRGFGEFKSKFGGEEITYIGSFIKYYGMGKVLEVFEKIF